MTASKATCLARCPYCDYCLAGLKRPRCPECGHTFHEGEFFAALEGRVGSTPWDERCRRGIARSLLVTLAGVMLQPTRFTAGISVFYPPARAGGLWFGCTVVAASCFFLRFLALQLPRNVPTGVAVTASCIGTVIIIAGVRAFEVVVGAVINAGLAGTCGERSRPYWQSLVRYGVLFLPFMSVLLLVGTLLRDVVLLPDQFASLASRILTFAARLALIGWWLIYVCVGILRPGIPRRRAATVVCAILLLTALAVALLHVPYALVSVLA